MTSMCILGGVLDIAAIRNQTPGCSEVVHLNNAGAALMPKQVVDRQIDHLKLEASIGGYEAAASAEQEIAELYRLVCRLINSSDGEIALVENATVAWQLAFSSIKFSQGDKIVTSRSSYASNYLNYLLAAERYGAEIVVAPSTSSGQVDVGAFAELLDDRVRLVALTHMPTSGGLVEPAEQIGSLVSNLDTLYLLDACQSVGQKPIDVKSIGCDMLCATGRKWLRGPRGTGFLYMANDSVDKVVPPFVDMRSATLLSESEYKLSKGATRFENWENNIAAQLGLGEAIRYIETVGGMGDIWRRVQELAADLRSKLKTIEGCLVHDVGEVQGGIVTFSLEGLDPEDIQSHLSEHGFNVSTTLPWVTVLDSQDRNLPAMVRASTHYYNTTDEIDRFCSSVQAASSLL